MIDGLCGDRRDRLRRAACQVLAEFLGSLHAPLRAIPRRLQMPLRLSPAARSRIAITTQCVPGGRRAATPPRSSRSAQLRASILPTSSSTAVCGAGRRAPAAEEWSNCAVDSTTGARRSSSTNADCRTSTGSSTARSPAPWQANHDPILQSIHFSLDEDAHWHRQGPPPLLRAVVADTPANSAVVSSGGAIPPATGSHPGRRGRRLRNWSSTIHRHGLLDALGLRRSAPPISPVGSTSQMPAPATGPCGCRRRPAGWSRRRPGDDGQYRLARDLDRGRARRPDLDPASNDDAWEGGDDRRRGRRVSGRWWNVDGDSSSPTGTAGAHATLSNGRLEGGVLTCSATSGCSTAGTNPRDGSRIDAVQGSGRVSQSTPSGER